MESGPVDCRDHLVVKMLERLEVVWRALEIVGCEVWVDGLDWTLKVVVQVASGVTFELVKLQAIERDAIPFEGRHLLTPDT